MNSSKDRRKRKRSSFNDGQVFDVNFILATELKTEVDAYVFLGQSNFHAAGIAYQQIYQHMF